MGIVIVGVVIFMIAVRVIPPRISSCKKEEEEDPSSDREKLVLKRIVVKKVVSTSKLSSDVYDNDDDDGDVHESVKSEMNILQKDRIILSLEEKSSLINDPSGEICKVISIDSRQSNPKLVKEVIISESASMCAICWGDYKEGDHICFSLNKKCNHAYHVDCMKTWLMKRNDCPMCRSDYL